MIRVVEEKDYSKIKGLVSQVHEMHLENRPDIYLDGDAFSVDYFHEILDDENMVCYVYEENQVICGFIMAMRRQSRPIPIMRSQTSYFIEAIVVNDHHRRSGIGKKLYYYLLERAREEQIDAIELNVWAFNEAAILFYKSLGMTVKNMTFEYLFQDDVEGNHLS